MSRLFSKARLGQLWRILALILGRIVSLQISRACSGFSGAAATLHAHSPICCFRFGIDIPPHGTFFQITVGSTTRSTSSFKKNRSGFSLPFAHPTTHSKFTVLPLSSHTSYTISSASRSSHPLVLATNHRCNCCFL